MANAENGYTRIAHEVLEALMDEIDSRLNLMFQMLLTADRLADKNMQQLELLKEESQRMREENERMRIFYQSALKAHSRLLDVTARRLLEKPIHELLAEEDERKRRTKKYTFGGVSPKVLNHE